MWWCVCVFTLILLPCVVAIAPNGANGEMLAAATITMNDEERLKLMEKFKKHELSETQVLSKVTNNMCVMCSVYTYVLCMYMLCV